MKIQTKVLYALRKHNRGEMAFKEILSSAELKPRQLYVALAELKKRGLIQKKIVCFGQGGYSKPPITGLVINLKDNQEKRIKRLIEREQ